MGESPSEFFMENSSEDSFQESEIVPLNIQEVGSLNVPRLLRTRLCRNPSQDSGAIQDLFWFLEEFLTILGYFLSEFGRNVL